MSLSTTSLPGMSLTDHLWHYLLKTMIRTPAARASELFPNVLELLAGAKVKPATLELLSQLGLSGSFPAADLRGLCEEEIKSGRPRQEALSRALFLWLIETLPIALKMSVPPPHLHRYLGHAYAAMQDSPRAIEAWKTQIQIHTDDALTLLELGLELCLENQAAQAVPYMVHAAQLQPRLVPVQRGRAMAYIRFGEFNGAMDAARHTVRLDPRSPLNHLTLALVYFHMRRFEESLEVAQQLLSLNDEAAEYHMAMGMAATGLEQWQTAVKAYEQAAKRSPQDPLIWYCLGHSRKNLGQLENAIDAFREVITFLPEHTRTAQELSGLYLRLGRYHEAIECLDRLVNLDPKNFELRFRRGYAQGRAGLWPQAIEAFEACAAEAPRRADIRQNLGIAYLRVGKPAKAVEELKIALRLEPTQRAATYSLTEAYTSLQMWDQLDIVLEEAILQAPEDRRNYLQLGIAYLARKRYQEALDTLLLCLYFQPRDPKAHFHIGQARGYLGQWNEARESFQNLVRCTEGDLRLIRRAVEFLDSHQQRQQAIDLLHFMVEIATTPAETLIAWHFAGETLLSKGLYPQALNAFTKARKCDSAHPPTLLGLGRCQVALGQKSDAMVTLTLLQKLDPAIADTLFDLIYPP